MKYRINTETKQVIENKNLGRAFRQAPWREATSSEITKYNLETLRKEKLKELSTKRNEYKANNGYESEYTTLNKINLLGGYTEQDKAECEAFFNDLIIKYDNFKEQINNATTKTALNNINITFEG